MKCADIPDGPILRLLANLPPYENGRRRTWGNWCFGDGGDVRSVMPPLPSDKLALAKMRQMIRRGVVGGCPCGCRGDFEITDKGRAELVALETAAAPLEALEETPA
jgi:hypothetical protein